MNMRSTLLSLALVAGGVASVGFPTVVAAQDDVALGLTQRLTALDANPQYTGLGDYERLQARQALAALVAARSNQREGARYVAERRVEVAETVARTGAMEREIAELDRQRSELIVEASRRDAAQARAEAERLRVQAQIQAEETARLREQAMSDAAVMEDVETALQGVSGVQTAKLSAAREREAELARQEAALMAGSDLPPSVQDARGEVFTLEGDSFRSGQSALTSTAGAQLRSLAAYLQAGQIGKLRIEGHTDDQGDADANQQLSERRAAAVRDALVSAGVNAGKIRVSGMGQGKPIADNGSAAGRAKNRRVEILVSSK